MDCMFILLPDNVHFRCLIVLRYYNQLPVTVRQCPVLQCPVRQCPVLHCPVHQCPVIQCPVLQCPTPFFYSSVNVQSCNFSQPVERSKEVVFVPWFLRRGDTPDFVHVFANRTHFWACGWFWLGSVQRALRVADEKEKEKEKRRKEEEENDRIMVKPKSADDYVGRPSYSEFLRHCSLPILFGFSQRRAHVVLSGERCRHFAVHQYIVWLWFADDWGVCYDSESVWTNTRELLTTSNG